CPGPQILDHDGALRCAVAGPKFATMNAVVRAEKQLSVHIGSLSRVNWRHEHGSFGGAIRLPQTSLHAIICSKENCSIHISETDGKRASWAQIDVLEQDGAIGSAVCFPKLHPVGPVVALEIDVASDRRETKRRAICWPRVDVLEQIRSLGSSVASIWLIAM